MKIYTIIGGVNGVGKSSLSGILAEIKSDMGMVVDTNKIIAECGGDKIKGGKIAVKKIDECLSRGITFTQETTLSGVKTLKTVKRAIAQNYFIRLYYVGVGSADESIERIKNRVRKGGHDIAAEDVKRRYEKRFDDLLKILPYCNEAYFFDNENGFVKKGEFKNGELTLYSGETPAWLQELADFVRVALP